MEQLYDGYDWSIGFLRDPGQWLEADKLESVLGTLEEIERSLQPHELSEGHGDYFTRLGHESPRLKAWGALDSVLRILPHPRELYAQPERFLGQFVSPMLPPRFFERSESRVSFRFDFPVDRFPRSARFLKAVLEALPEFIGSGRAHAPHAHVEWIGDRVLIDWSDRQVGFEATPQSGLTEPVLSPELARTILADLASSQREVEIARARVKELEQQLELHKAQSPENVSLDEASASAGSDERVRAALHEVYRFNDYFARAQQMITLLSRPGVRAPEIEGLHRRMSWNQVQREATECAGRAVAILQGQALVDSVPNDDNMENMGYMGNRGNSRSEARTLYSPSQLSREGGRQTSLLNSPEIAEGVERSPVEAKIRSQASPKLKHKITSTKSVAQPQPGAQL